MRVQRTVRALAAGSLAALLCLAPQLARAEDTPAFRIADERITESSGLAADTKLQAYWTTNDSGDSGRVFAVDPQGKTLGVANYRADVVDVEALAMRDRRLYVGDIGDNDAERDFVTVYFFDNLTPGGGTATYRSYDFRYPGGPRNAEALLVDGSGRLFIVSKEEEKGGIYAAPTEPSRSGVNELERVGDAPAIVTDGTFLPDGRMVLRTYTSIEVLDPKSYQVVASEPAPAQEQGESVTVDLAGTGLLVGSEGTDSPVYAVPVPGAASTSPSASAPAAGADDPGDPVDTGLPEGILSAVGLAAVVAIVAGVVVGLARSRR